MKKTKEKILLTAHRLFNEQGVAAVSIRKIAATLEISHTNLIYHFKTKQELIEALHQQILEAAIKLNQEVRMGPNMLEGLWEATKGGFRILYDYRFFMIDLVYIMKENKQLHHRFLEIEQIRSEMYQDMINKAIQQGLMRDVYYPDEYQQLITHIRIFSDFWISSAAIYSSEDPQTVIDQHAKLLLDLFFPYLTVKGRKAYRVLLEAS
ncbi:MAG: TetR/AcrR family transcriptional regulator [Bacteroidota bacterium]